MPITFWDSKGEKRLETDEDILKELSQGKKIKVARGKEQREIHPSRVVLSKCKLCKNPLATILKETPTRALIECIICNSCAIIGKKDIKKVYTPDNPKEDKTAKSKSFVKVGA